MHKITCYMALGSRPVQKKSHHVDMTCAWGEAGDQCCPFVVIIATSVGSVLACVACMALALYIWQPRLSPAHQFPAPDDGGAVRITLPHHLATGHSTPMDLDIRIYPPGNATASATTMPTPHDVVTHPDSSRRHKQLSKSRPLSSSNSAAHARQRQHPQLRDSITMDSINYFTTDPPCVSSYRPSTVISQFSQYAFSELSSEASNNMSSVAGDGILSSYMPIMDEQRHLHDDDIADYHHPSRHYPHRHPTKLDSTTSQASSNATFMPKSFKSRSSLKGVDRQYLSGGKQYHHRTSRLAGTNAAAMPSTPQDKRLSTRALVDSDLQSYTSASIMMESPSVVSSTVTEVMEHRPGASTTSGLQPPST